MVRNSPMGFKCDRGRYERVIDHEGSGGRTVVGRVSRVAFELAAQSSRPTLRGVHKGIRRCARRWPALQRHSADVKLDLPQGRGK